MADKLGMGMVLVLYVDDSYSPEVRFLKIIRADH